MSRSVLLIVLVIAVLAALLWVVPRKSEGPEGASQGPLEPREPSAPTLKGARRVEPVAPAEGPAAAPGALRGTVRSADGRPLVRPRVYLLPKTSGGDYQVDASTKVDDDGRWILEGVDPKGHWIGAKARDHRPAHADGDFWDGGPVELVLEAGREVAVRVATARGDVPPGIRIEAVPPPRSGTFPFPGPGRRVSFNRTEAPLGELEVRFTLPTDGPVLVRPRVPGHVVRPAELILQIEDAVAAFEAVPACRLEVVVRDAETGERIEGGFELVLLDLRTGREVYGRDSKHSFDSWMALVGLPPGSYTLMVERVGYHRFASAPVHLTEPGSRATVEADLLVDPAAGSLEILLAPPADVSLGERRIAVVGRGVGSDGTLGVTWERLTPRSIEAGGRLLVVGPLRTGEWEILVWAGARLVGYGEASVRGGSPDRVTVDLGPGLVADLDRWERPGRRRGVVDHDTYVVSVKTQAGRTLPVIRWRSRQRFVVGIGPPPPDHPTFGGIVPLHAVLGPYPFEVLRVSTYEEDAPPEWIVRAE